jgi:hypothetical protein
MSQQERHPLDERFRQVLEHAEVAPPPAVWQAVKQARDGGRRRAGWWRWFFPALAVLLLTGLSATYFALRSPKVVEEQAVQVTMAQEAAPEHQPLATSGNRAVAGTVASRQEAENTATSIEPQLTDPGAIVPKSTQPTRSSATVQTSGVSGGMPVAAEQHHGGARPEPLQGSPSTSMLIASVASPSAEEPKEIAPVSTHDVAEGGTLDQRRDDAMDLDGLLIRVPAYPQGAGLMPNAVPEPAPYLLPHGEWWVAPVVGVHAVRDRWRGSDDRLVDALGNATGTNTSFAFGLAAGRQWRSGFGLSTGLMNERMESQLYHRDRRVQMEQEITTYLVTLNTQVFVSDVDTTTTVITEDRSSSGSQRRTAWRVPVDVHKRWSMGRLQLGLRGGFALEWTTAQGATLVATDTEGGLVAADPGAAEFRARNPMALLGTVGAEVGWMLNERWTLWVDPVYMSGVSALSRPSTAYTLPQRWGIQFGLAHHFIPSRSR